MNALNITATLSLATVLPIFGVAAGVVWWAGSRLPHLVAVVGLKTGIGQAFAGMLLLGGITTLPELATALNAAAIGAGKLALNNSFGSASFNLLLLAFADTVIGRRALTWAIARPATLLQGVLGMLLLGLAAAAILIGDRPIGPVGIGSSLLFAACLAAMWIAAQYETRPTWTVVDPPDLDRPPEEPNTSAPLSILLSRLVALALLILVGGMLLAHSAETIAVRTGLGSGLVGLIFLGVATSLTELTAIITAVRDRRYELAVGDIFGANLFNIAMIFAIDLCLPGVPVLRLADNFEAGAALLALLLTGIFVVGFLERGNRTIFRMGYDSLAVVFVYAAGVMLLAT